MHVLREDEIDFSHYMAETEDAARVRCASEYLPDVMHQIAPAHDAPRGPRLPFNGGWVYFAPGEVTLWGGFNNSGKSILQGQVMDQFALQGEKVCIASFEMKPGKTLARIARQACGVEKPTREQVSTLLTRLKGSMWLYDQQGTVKWERLIAVIKHCAEKLKCRHIAIDSMMKCVRGVDDYNGQKEFIDALTACARDYGIHIHLVVHLKKGDGDERMPTRMDISGAGAISDLVDNVLLVWRNKKKERDRDAGKHVNEYDPDAVLVCDKQRNGDWEGRVRLWYDRGSLKFTDGPKRGIATAL